jgi:hypothetical protein
VDISPEVDALARAQHGVVSRLQLADVGVTPSELRWAIGRRWRLLLPGVVLLSPELPDERQRRVAALLYAGPDAWLAGPTAAAFHGLGPERPGSRVHALVPAPHRPRDVAWLRIRRTHLLDERVVERGPLRFSCRARSAVDAAASMTDDEARALLIEVVQRRMVRLDDLAHWVEARRPNGRKRLRAALTEAASGSWSLPEADLALLVSGSRVLPPAWANPTLRDARGRRLTTPDLWFDDVALAVMVHSRQFHESVLDWERTVSGDSDLTAARIALIGVTPAAIARDPGAVLRRVEAAHRQARASGFRPDVTATPRDLGLTSRLMSHAVS